MFAADLFLWTLNVFSLAPLLRVPPGIIFPGGKCCQPALPRSPTPTLCFGKCNFPGSCRQATVNSSDVSLEKTLFSGKIKMRVRKG